MFDKTFQMEDRVCCSQIIHLTSKRVWIGKLTRIQALTRFSISRKSREEMVHFFLSRAGELNFHFSRCSRMSRFWWKNSRSPLEIRDFEKNSLSLLERMRFCKQILFLILHSMSFPILVRNHILLFGLILTISVLQKGKVFLKDSSVLLSNILTSVYKSTLWRLLRPRVISGSILNGCPVERAYAKHARMRS